MVEKHRQLGQETLCGEQDFDYPINEDEADAIEPRGKNVPGRFESRDVKFKNNLKSERFQEPRMFTMQQVRNMFFALLNQSMQNDRAATAEGRLDKMHQECVRLDETDQALEKDVNDKHRDLSDRLAKWREDFSQQQRINEKTLNEHRLKLATANETLTRHKEQLDE